ncbi:MAG: septal ring lytic transglycosylase RlpA family protein [Sandaracinus sp.]|nr:septal ring lytic transglycosylase RlpA family protein [Sandaracinus sp.]MCB9622632.1 septal ring lytic transglycosylase RlpA family protein [Sandaracinus sp.]
MTSTTEIAPGGERIVEVREGRASYYSDRLAGRSTASGEPYDPRAFTAASRDLPFGTRVRVHRLDADGRSMRSVVVRVNDRGPFRDHRRILDLSRAAAESLDMIRAGVVSIRAEILAD